MRAQETMEKPEEIEQVSGKTGVAITNSGNNKNKRAKGASNLPKAQAKQTHVSDTKKKLVKDLAELMKKKTVMIVSIKNLPSSQFQDIKKKLRGKAVVQVAKMSLVDFALEHAKNEILKELVKYGGADCAILFSDEDAFELSAFLSENKSPARAKAGQESPEDIKVEAGPTDLIPGPDISALSSVGLQVKVENGKIAIQESRVLVKKGEAISEEKVSILAKLGITPFEIGLEPIAAFSEGKVYKDIKIDKEATLEELKEMFGRSLAFAVSLDYVCEDNLSFILRKAVSHENAIDSLVKEDAPVEKEKKEDKIEQNNKEGKEAESPTEDGRGDTKTSDVGEANASGQGDKRAESETKSQKVKKKDNTQENKTGEGK